MKRIFGICGALVGCVVLILVFGVQDTDAGVVAGIATEWTQLLNNLELTMQYAEQLQQAATQIQQYETQVQHLQQAMQQTNSMVNGLKNFNFANLAGDINTINLAVQYGNSLSYTMANLDDEFNQRYPGYGNTTGANFAQQYRGWYSTNLDTAHAAMKVTGIQNSQLNNDAALVQALQQQSENSTTLLQTMQVANSMAAQEIAELEKLRQLMMTDIQSKATYQAQQAAQSQAQDDLTNQFFAPPPDGNSDTRTYPPLPDTGIQ